MDTKNRRPVTRLVIAAVAASSALVLTACGGSNGGNGGNNPQSGPAQSGGGDEVAATPRAFIGKQVSLNGIVGQVFGPHTFTLVEHSTGGTSGGGNSGSGSNGESGTSTGGSGGNNAGQAHSSGAGAYSNTLLVVSKAPVTLAPGSAARLTGTVAPAFSPQAAQSFSGSAPSSPALNDYNGQPFIQTPGATAVSAGAGPEAGSAPDRNEGGTSTGNNGAGSQGSR